MVASSPSVCKMDGMTKTEFGTRLRRLRIAAHKTQRDISIALDVYAPTVGLWERGETAPSVLVLGRLASVLGVSVSDLAG